jgi:hypothetical protein
MTEGQTVIGCNFVKTSSINLETNAPNPSFMQHRPQQAQKKRNPQQWTRELHGH